MSSFKQTCTFLKRCYINTLVCVRYSNVHIDLCALLWRLCCSWIRIKKIFVSEFLLIYYKNGSYILGMFPIFINVYLYSFWSFKIFIINLFLNIFVSSCKPVWNWQYIFLKIFYFMHLKPLFPFLMLFFLSFQKLV